MALDQSVLAELAAALKSGEVGDLVREAVRLVCQELIEAEATAAIGAGPSERSEARTSRAQRAPGCGALLRAESARTPRHFTLGARVPSPHPGHPFRRAGEPIKDFSGRGRRDHGVGRVHRSALGVTLSSFPGEVPAVRRRRRRKR
jgi:hypothetical protein